MNSWKEEVKEERNTEMVKEGGSESARRQGEMFDDYLLCLSRSEKLSHILS